MSTNNADQLALLDLDGAPRRIALFGATRGVGRSFLDLALAAGHHVTALVRDPARLDLSHPRLTLVTGDVTDPASTRAAIEGADTVVCALGAPARDGSRIRERGTVQIVAAMQHAGVRRLLCVSVLGARETRGGLPALYRWIVFPLFLRRAVADHERQEEVIEASGLDYTIVRPPNLTDGPVTADIAAGFGADMRGISMKISRADVAGFMLQRAERGDYMRRTVAVSYRAA